MLSPAQNICWPYIHRDKLAKASERKACTDVGKNLKPVIPHSKWSPLVNCTEPIEELQIHFGGPFLNEKGFEQYFQAGTDSHFKYRTKQIVYNV